MFPINGEETQLLLWIIDRRHNTIIASQYEPPEWLAQIPNPVATEAIRGRLSAQVYRILIKDNKLMGLQE